MAQEEKELLLKDLLARLPYGVKIELTWWVMCEETCVKTGIKTILELDHIEQFLNNKDDDVEIKPYLRSMDSMTDEELVEFLGIKGRNLKSEELKTFRKGQTAIVSTLPSYSRRIDWLNAHHFDNRGLIEKGLAFEAPDDLYNN